MSDRAVPVPRPDAGFTLLETLVVLVVLGLGVYLVAVRGPLRSAGLDGQAAAARIAGALRGARTEAVNRNRAVEVLFDPENNRFGERGAAPVVLPPGVALRTVLPAGRSGIGFAPDGSSTGGTVVVLLPGNRRLQVAVSWLTGRVTLGEAP